MKGRALPVTLFLHCESGTVATAVAAGFLAVTGEAEPAAAAERVRAATEGKLVCRVAEAQRVAELALELKTAKGKRSGKAGKATAGPSAKGGAVAPAIASGTPATVGKVGYADGDDDKGVAAAATTDIGDEDDDDEEEDGGGGGSGGGGDDDDGERAAIRANYARAVARHGLPGARAPPGSGDCGGWTTVAVPLKRPAGATMSYSGAAKAANMAVKQEQALSDKQRKNRRKAEKAREEAAEREALMMERREAARVARQR